MKGILRGLGVVVLLVGIALTALVMWIPGVQVAAAALAGMPIGIGGTLVIASFFAEERW